LFERQKERESVGGGRGRGRGRGGLPAEQGAWHNVGLDSGAPGS